MSTREDTPLLALCPFCGSRNVDPEGWASLVSSGPACDDCGAAGPHKIRSTPEENITAWNRRAAPTPPAAEAPGQEPVAAKEELAKLLWERFAPDHEVDWPSSDAAEYRSVAEDIFRSALVSAPPTYADAEAKGHAPELPRYDANAWPHGFHNLWNEQSMRSFARETAAYWRNDAIQKAADTTSRYAEAEAKGFERGIEAAAKWHDERATIIRAMVKPDQSGGSQIALIQAATRHEINAAAIRSLASPAPKGET